MTHAFFDEWKDCTGSDENAAGFLYSSTKVAWKVLMSARTSPEEHALSLSRRRSAAAGVGVGVPLPFFWGNFSLGDL